MLIKKINLINYRQYANETIEFPAPFGKKNIVVLEGRNGAGKTNIMNAITWCLYGRELHLNKKSLALPAVNTISLKESPSACEVKVEIVMTDNEGNKAIFVRSTKYCEENGEVKEIPNKQKFELLREIGDDMKFVSDPTYVANQLIPESIVDYFLFDGEKLESYFREKSGEEIKKEIFKLSQLEVLKKAISHLGAIQNEFVRKSKKLTPPLADAQEKIDTWGNSLNNYKADLEKFRKIKNEKVKDKNEIAEELKSMPNIRNLQETREELERDLKDLEKTIKDKRDELTDFLVDSSLHLLTYPAIESTIKEITREQDRENVPPNIDPKYVEKLLKDGKCICGTDITKKNISCRKKVESLLKKISDISAISSDLIKLKSDLARSIDNLKNFDTSMIKLEREIKKLETDYENKSKKLKKIKEQVDSKIEEKFRILETRYGNLDTEITKLSEDIGERAARVKMAESQLETYRREREKELERSKEFDELNKVVSFCDEAVELATEVKKNIMKDTREKINQITKESFFNLIWKKKEWKDVKINDDYEISVMHRSGHEGLGSLSRGEMEALALSFINALSAYSGFDFPIVMDTPLGRISGEIRENICKNLPKYLKNKQVILLMTDTEYTPTVREKLSDNLIGEYKITFEELKTGSKAQVGKYGK